jgi:hypothetical protein
MSEATEGIWTNEARAAARAAKLAEVVDQPVLTESQALDHQAAGYPVDWSKVIIDGVAPVAVEEAPAEAPVEDAEPEADDEGAGEDEGSTNEEEPVGDSAPESEPEVEAAPAEEAPVEMEAEEAPTEDADEAPEAPVEDEKPAKAGKSKK